jgi:hypothetical protein
LFSCEKEFNPRDKYKDITIIYCLINPVDSVHYIRINKAFLGPGSIIDMAKNPDSSLYPVEDLDVRIYDITSTGDRTQLKADTITIKNKESGYFYYPKQRVYYFEKTFEKTISLGDDMYEPDNTIAIEVESKKTGKIIYAQTKLVNSVNIQVPARGVPLNLAPDKDASKFRWINAKNGRIYDVYYTMYYQEGRRADSSVKIFRKDSLVWHVGSYSALKTGDGTSQTENFQYNPGSFYAQLQKNIDDDPSLWRMAYKEVKIAIWCGSEDLYYYHNINDPAQGLTQDRPEYTNLKTKLYSVELGDYKELENEAFGLFSSRIVQYRPILLSDEMVMKHLPATNRQFLNRPADED